MVSKTIAQGTEALMLRHYPYIKEEGMKMVQLRDLWKTQFDVADERFQVKVMSVNEKNKQKVVKYLHGEDHLHEKKEEGKPYAGIVLMLETGQLREETITERKSYEK